VEKEIKKIKKLTIALGSEGQFFCPFSLLKRARGRGGEAERELPKSWERVPNGLIFVNVYKKQEVRLDNLNKTLGKTALEKQGGKDYNPPRTQGKEAKKT